jgi:hypothetical protein
MAMEGAPSEETIKEAGEAHLTDKQKEATEHRSNIFEVNARRNKGKEGGLMLLRKGRSEVLKEGPFEEIYQGEINGHEVLLTVGGSKSKSRSGLGFNVNPTDFKMVVDGHEMSKGDAQKIYNIYGFVHMTEGGTERDLEAVKQEQEAFELEEIRKDLGL